MPKGLLFWVVFVIAVLFGCWANWGGGTANPPNMRWFGVSAVIWVLIFLLGWGVYGFVVQ
jgi:hypothetical protein